MIPLIEIGGVVLSTEIITEWFACDLDACLGACCVEGDAGAPVTLDEVAGIEASLDAVWPCLSATAQAEVERSGVAYTDVEGDLVTTIVRGRDCAFTCYNVGAGAVASLPEGCCLCALERAWREGRSGFCKPVSCALYPVREKRFASGLVGLSLHRWDICAPAFERGRREGVRVYEFLAGPLRQRFGAEWYEELCLAARQVLLQR